MIRIANQEHTGWINWLVVNASFRDHSIIVERSVFYYHGGDT